ncbi:MAG: 2-oxo acid dehydrogenase subunit E2 [Actinobacteria bacterium]|nr:2-oxo acid dehydrogenase subunit E2 [Actinomycetota bacterium]
MPDFKLPDLGEGVTEAEIDKWLVEEGDVVEEDDLIVEVITDKATAEIPSPFAGTVSRIHAKEGDVVPVGTVLITIGDATSSDRGTGVAVPAGLSPDAPPPPPPADRATASPEAASGNGVAVKAMPPVRKLARELGVDLESVTGSGPQGRILRADVEAVASTPGPSQAAPSIPGGARVEIPPGGRREHYRGIRRTIGERMTQAHLTIPPVTHVEDCDVTELDATRRLANERAHEMQKLTFLPFIVKAVIAALKDHPAMNASLDEEAGEIVFHDRYNIGIAVDTPAGLTVPVIKDADKKRLRDIAAELERLSQGARAGTLEADELRGTFTITSPGKFGGLMATPIIFHPQAGILGVHRAAERPVVRDGQIVARLMMNLSITFDHRILDGLTAAKFCLDVVRLLEHPAVLALES